MERGSRDPARLPNPGDRIRRSHARRGFPRRLDREKWLVIGRGVGRRLVEVIYLLDDDGTAFVVHAMPVTIRPRRA